MYIHPLIAAAAAIGESLRPDEAPPAKYRYGIPYFFVTRVPN